MVIFKTLPFKNKSTDFDAVLTFWGSYFWVWLSGKTLTSILYNRVENKRVKKCQIFKSTSGVEYVGALESGDVFLRFPINVPCLKKYWFIQKWRRGSTQSQINGVFDGKFSVKLMYLYPALSNIIETMWQYTCFALNMPIENDII